MKVLYTTEEGGIWTPLEIKVPKGDIFALCLPDGTIWDSGIGIYRKEKLEKDEFEELYKGDHLL